MLGKLNSNLIHMEKGRFNLRIYGLMIKNEKVLVTRELIRDKMITKFPGGGLEYGEGTVDCLKREFIEELNLPIKISSHFYTTDFFVQSYFDSSQVISIYYLVDAEMDKEPQIQENEKMVKSFEWISISNLNSDNFTFPIDKKICEQLKKSSER